MYCFCWSELGHSGLILSKKLCKSKILNFIKNSSSEKRVLPPCFFMVHLKPLLAHTIWLNSDQNPTALFREIDKKIRKKKYHVDTYFANERLERSSSDAVLETSISARIFRKDCENRTRNFSLNYKIVKFDNFENSYLENESGNTYFLNPF